jgi:hypothetical protein
MRAFYPVLGAMELSAAEIYTTGVEVAVALSCAEPSIGVENRETNDSWRPAKWAQTLHDEVREMDHKC